MTKKKDPSQLIRKPVPESELNPNSRYNKRYRQKHPDRSVARSQVNRSIRDGKLKRQPCSVCGAEPAEAHHPDYSQPLLVVWLCHDCHVEEHHGPVEERMTRQAASEQERQSKRSKTRKRKYVPRPRQPSKKAVLSDKAKLLRQEGLSYKQIAESLQVSQGQAYKYVNDPDYN